MTREYRIGELAQEANVTKRTIHYYVGRGLLPPPEGAGVGSSYNEEHLAKLRLIKKLQEEYLPLGKIREIVSALNMDEARQLLSEPTPLSRSVIQRPEYQERREMGKPEVLNEGLQSREIQPTESEIKGSSYTRLELGLGMELHFPAELLRENAALVNSIEKYARRLIDEK